MRCNPLIILALVVAAGIGGGTAAAAPADPPRSYALVVGSNAAGQGQDHLRYAERDARRVAEVLRDLGGYDAERIRVLTRPGPQALLDALQDIGRALERDAEDGVRSVFFFYYSGHARSRALDLGPEQLSLERLRSRIMALPTTLTVVVLDACQSGAFSRVKGAEPAADFSFNSVSGLHAEGVAVMASSSGTELSQESERLRSSYFTHHLLVALRGAGDGNGDGRVSLDEAYRYAYASTLAGTSRTAVGGQHVTLETDLRGKGEVALTFPAEADAHLELPGALEATVLVQIRGNGAVMAELHKSRGAPLRVALPPGTYVALVRTGDGALECQVALERHRVTTLATDRCREVVLEQTAAKHAAPVGPRYAFELSGGVTGVDADGYTDRLRDFGFSDDGDVQPVVTIGVAYRLHRNVHLAAELGSLETASWRRRGDTLMQDFDWRVVAGGAYFRGVLPTRNQRHALFAQVGGGAARAGTSYVDHVDGAVADTSSESHWGLHLGAAAGAYATLLGRFGLMARVRYDYAPVMENLIGDVHDSGGLTGSVGLRASF